MSFVQELKNRNVFRVAIAYLLAAWLVLQVVDTVAPILGLPDLFSRTVLLLLAIGFPISIVLAWVFELTPDGIKKEKDVERSASISHHTGRNLDFIIIGVLSAAVVMFAFDKFMLTSSDVGERAKQTIAVLPLVNMSDDSDQEYFSEGLSEELLNLLAQIPELRVTSRTSAFSFRDKDLTIPEIGRALDVAYVLDGSVRRSGETIRITVQLIEVADDSHVWSDTWDRDFQDVFAIQDEIADFVVDALKLELLGNGPRVFETTQEVYELYLQAKFLLEHPTKANILQAEGINQRIIEMDPGYVPAWTQRARIYNSGPGWGAWEVAVAGPLAREAASKSVELYDKNAEAHAILAWIAMDLDYNYELAATEIETALKLGTDNAFVFSTAAEYQQRHGNLDEAIAFFDRAYEIDPIKGRGITAALAYFYAGRQEEAISMWEEAIELSPQSSFLHRSLALSLLEIGDIDGALAEVEKEPVAGYRFQALALIFQSMGESDRSKEELDKLIADGIRWTWEITEVYAFRDELDEAFEWIDRAIERNDRGLRHVLYSPYLESMRNDPRFENVLSRIGLSSDP